MDVQVQKLLNVILSNEKRPGKTITRSFRIDEVAFKAIEEEALHRNITTNTLVNQLLVKYAKFDRHLSKARVMKVAPILITQFLDPVPEEKIIEIAKDFGKDSAYTSLIVAMKGELTQDRIIEHLKDMADDDAFEYSDVTSGDRRTITIIHYIGRKFSIFVAYHFAQLFELIGAYPKFSPSEHAVAFEFNSSGY